MENSIRTIMWEGQIKCIANFGPSNILVVFFYSEQLVVNGLYLLKLVKRKLIILFFTGSAVLISVV